MGIRDGIERESKPDHIEPRRPWKKCDLYPPLSPRQDNTDDAEGFHQRD